MKKKLKKYRKKHNLSKLEMAKKLGIDIEIYKRIVSKKEIEIDDDLKSKINLLFTSNKEESKSVTNKAHVTLPKGLHEQITNIQFQSPLFESLEKISKPYKDIQKHMAPLNSITKFTLPKFNFTSPKDESSILKGIKGWTTTLNEQVTAHNKVFQNFFDDNTIKGWSNSMDLIKELSESVQESTKGIDLSSISSWKMVTEAVSNNPELYNNYLGFNSEIAETLSPILQKTFIPFPDELYTAAKSIQDNPILSGSSFLAFTHFKNFDEEIEVLEQIQSDPKLTEEASEFIEELSEIISDNPDGDEHYDFTLLEDLFIRFSVWIASTFDKAKEDASIIAKALMVRSGITIWAIFALMIVQQNALSNKTEHKKTQALMDSVVKEQQADKKRDEEIINKLNQLELEDNYLIALIDANLRRINNKRSKKLGTVKKGQIVKVVELKVKWAHVLYEDVSTSELLTGWVHISSFKSISR